MTQADIARLLAEAQAAHHDYEETELQGVYDEEWPAWYATYVIEHGLSDKLAKPVSSDRLGRFLAESYQRYERTDDPDAWNDFTAADIIAYFG